MTTIDMPQFILIAFGTGMMAMIVLRSIGQRAVSVASFAVDDRRAYEKRCREENAAAEAAGRAAALEPLALNPDGSVEEPIIGVVEVPEK
jgi:hypothetical protein